MAFALGRLLSSPGPPYGDLPLGFRGQVFMFYGGGNGNPLLLLSLGKSHGQRSLASYSPWGSKESDTTELLSVFVFDVYFSLSFI